MTESTNRITIGADNIVTGCSPEGVTASMPLANLIEHLVPQRWDAENAILPNGVKCVQRRGNTIIWVHQTPPRRWNLKWLTADSPKPFGAEANYRQVTIALPYVCVLAVFGPGRHGPHLTSKNECFFMNSPLRGLDDAMMYPALLNCSKFKTQLGKPLSWICTQYLNRDELAAIPDTNVRMRKSLDGLVRTLFETGFNLSSEHNEETSWFSATVAQNVDPRIASIEAWEQATGNEDPLFALKIPWLQTELTLGQIMERIFEHQGARDAPVTSMNDLVRLIFTHSELARRRARLKAKEMEPLFKKAINF